MDGYFEIGLSPWDMAAGLLLVTEAGGRVGPWPGGAAGPLDMGRLLATNGPLHPWLESLVGGHAAGLETAAPLLHPSADAAQTHP